MPFSNLQKLLKLAMYQRRRLFRRPGTATWSRLSEARLKLNNTKTTTRLSARFTNNSALLKKNNMPSIPTQKWKKYSKWPSSHSRWKVGECRRLQLKCNLNNQVRRWLSSLISSVLYSFKLKQINLCRSKIKLCRSQINLCRSRKIACLIQSRSLLNLRKMIVNLTEISKYLLNYF